MAAQLDKSHKYQLFVDTVNFCGLSVNCNKMQLSEPYFCNDGINDLFAGVWSLWLICPSVARRTVGILTCQSVQGQKED